MFVVRLILVFMLMLVFQPARAEAEPMTVELDQTTGQYIDFNNLPGIIGIQTRVFMWWLDLDDVATATGYGRFFVINQIGGTDEYITVAIATNFNGSVNFNAVSSGGTGAWEESGVVTTGMNHVAVVFDNSDTSNNPSLYVNGVSQTFTERLTPSGSFYSGTGSDVYLGGFGDDSINGQVYSSLIYNVTGWTTASIEALITSAYNHRYAVPTAKGLIFAPRLVHAEGVTTVEGTTLGGTNYIYDMISGAQGTPTGSPVLHSDDYLRYNNG